MKGETIATMDKDEFAALLEYFIERGEDRVTPQTFFQVMADVAAQRNQHAAELPVETPSRLGRSICRTV